MWQSTKNIYHLFQAIAANIWYRFPSRKLIIIGVTGTDGKTTTASMIYHILNKSGYKAALVTSISAVIDGKPFDIGFHVTTPRFFALRSYLKKAKKLGAKYFVLEVTSHALDQHRVYGIPFKVGVLTNITNEHLDYHKTYNRYVKAKAKLLQNASVAIINKDDKSYKFVKPRLRNKNVITYGMKNDSQINPHRFPFHTKLIGKYNLYDSLAAISATQALGVPNESIRKAIATFTLPLGRGEVVYDKDFKVVIDFAHTPNSFASILPEMKKLTKGRLIHVFGSAGKRDPIKRPQMGKISSENADIIILTAEDPRDEPIEKINNEIESGMDTSKFIIDSKRDSEIEKSKKYLFKIPDRKEAIEFAISLAQKGDIIILTGKSHEKSMNYGQGEEAWSEHEAVTEALDKNLRIKNE